jgi:TRAP-type C4-dicarboxylate transport system permease small subunit
MAGLVSCKPAIYRTIKNIMSIIWKALDKFSEGLKTLYSVTLTGMMLLTVVDVIGRFFKYPIFRSVKLVGFMATIVVATALPYTYKQEGHVGVEILVRLMSKKTQIVIDILTRLINLVLFSLITCQIFLYDRDMHETGEVSMNLEFPIYYIYNIPACNMSYRILTIIEKIFENFKKLRELGAVSK